MNLAFNGFSDVPASLLDALPANVALLDEEGVIRAVNESWRRFAAANGLPGADAAVGENYLEVCGQVRGGDAREAREAAAGIRRVFQREADEFAMEYACHPPGGRRWFRMTVTPLHEADRRGAAVMHLDITERREADEERHRLLATLKERVKELHALHRAADLLRDCERAVPGLLEDMVALLPPAFLRPENTAARVAYGGVDCASPGFLSTERLIDARFATSDGREGLVQVVVLEPPGADEIVFLPEERRLIESLAELLQAHFEHRVAVGRLQASNRDYERQHAALAALICNRLWTVRDEAAALREIAETVAHTLDVERVSVWRFRPDRTAIVCQDLYQASTRTHLAGQELTLANFPAYSAALAESRVIAAEAARQDARTRELAAGYLEPQGIHSLLDVPILVEGVLDGILCLEPVGPPRAWTHGEQNFALAAASLVALFLAQRARSRSEARFSFIFNASPAAISINTVADGRYLELNDRYSELFGYTREEMMRSSVVELKLWADPEERASVMRRLVAERSVRELETRFRHRSGNIMHVLLSLQLLELAGEPEPVLIAQLTDITQKRLAEQALRESEQRFRLLSKATNDAIWDWDLTTNALWWNEGFETLFGYGRDEVEPNIDSWYNRLHPDDREAVVASIHKTIDSGGESWSREYRFRCRDGQHAFVLDRGHVIRDATGRPLRMVGGMTDLTKWKAAETRLRDQATLLDQARDAIFVRDMEDRVVYWNRGAEGLYGWTAAEALGRPISDLIYREPNTFVQTTEAVLRLNEWRGELEQFTKDGRKLTVDNRWTLVRDDAGQPRSILCINSDLTEKKRQEAQTLRAQRMESIGTLAGGIAHDFNNLLAPILISVQLLEEEIQSEEGRTMLATVQTCARRGADLVKQVLTFARGVEGERIEVQLGHLLRDLRQVVRETFPKNIKAAIQYPNDLRPVLGDPTQLYQVLMNLCVNARDAMPAGGQIEVRAENRVVDEVYAGTHADARPGPYVVITVKDTGTGIPAALAERIFEPFFTTKEEGKGTGLGLSTTLSIVRDHGGFLTLQSEPGKGATFEVFLPARDRAATEAGDPVEASLPPGRGELVLLVDDEEGIREITRKTLERHGYRVILAANGAEGVAQYAQRGREIDLVLTDLIMPVMDGPAMVVALKSLNPEVRIVGSSGLQTEETMARARAVGVRDFVPKPYSAAMLLSTLARVLQTPPEPGPPSTT